MRTGGFQAWSRHIRRCLAATVVALAVAGLLLPVPVGAATPSRGHHAGSPVAGTKVSLVSMAAVRQTLSPERAKARARVGSVPQASEPGRRPAHLSPVGASAPAASIVQPQGPPVVGVNQPGLQAQESGGNFPPDTTGAIGPLNYLEFVNSRVAVYDRTLTLVASIDLASFVGFPLSNVFDPQILFSPTSSRWFYAADLGMSALVMGWSKTADLTDLLNGWCQFGADTGMQFHDFPKLGGDDNSLALPGIPKMGY